MLLEEFSFLRLTLILHNRIAVRIQPEYTYPWKGEAQGRRLIPR